MTVFPLTPVTSSVRAGATARVRRLFAAALVALSSLLCLASSGHAGPQIGQTRTVGSLSVTMDHPRVNRVARGFAPVRGRVLNGGDSRQTLRIDEMFPGAYRMAQHRQSLLIRLEPGETRDFEFLVPVDRSNSTARGTPRAWIRSGFDSGDFRMELVSEPPSLRGRVIGVVTPNGLPVAETTRLQSLLPLGLEGDIGGVFETASSGRSSAAAKQAAEVFSLGFDELPLSVAGWSFADTVFVYADGALSASPTWEPLIQWARQGGQLVFLGESLADRLAELTSLTPWLGPQHRVVEGAAAPPLAMNEGGLRLYRAGFGLLGLSPSIGGGPVGAGLGASIVDTLRALDGPAVYRSNGAVTRASFLAHAYRSKYKSPWSEPFPDSKIPIVLILAVLGVFAILVGPLSVLLSRRSGRPSQLLLAVPVLSLAATAAIVGLGLGEQGMDTEGHAHSLAILDQGDGLVSHIMRRELVLGRGGKALRPRSGTTVLVADLEMGDEVRMLDVDEGEPVLSGDFLPVRARSQHLVLSAGESAARLEWEPPRGQGTRSQWTMRITNRLGVDLVGLEVQSLDGQVYGASEPVHDGASAELMPLEESRLEARFGELVKEPFFGRVRLRNAGFLAEAAAPGPGVDHCSIEMKELFGVHGIVGRLSHAGAHWER